MYSRFPWLSLLVWSGIILASCARYADGTGIPRAALTELQQQYPEAEAVEWTQYDRQYVAGFFDLAASRAVEMTFDKRGRWIQTLTNLDLQDLPPEVTTYLREEFRDYYATAYLLRFPDRSEYGLTVDTPTHIYTLSFDRAGQLLERTEETLDAD
jgi:hypothetical protein